MKESAAALAPPTVRVFLSWAKQDEPLKNDLLDRLVPNLKILRNIRFEFWEMSDLRCGEEFEPAILDRLDECDAGLQLLSPAFFASSFIKEHETPVFCGPAARRTALPVALRTVPLDPRTWDLQGIDRLQIHYLEGRAYVTLTGHRRDEFAQRLAERVRDRLLERPAWRGL